MSISKNKNKGLKWLSAGVIVILIALGLYQRAFITAYVDNFKKNPYKPSDRINISGSSMAKTSIIPVFRLTKDESGYLTFPADIEISNDSLHKYKTTYIGKYIDYKLVPFSRTDKSTGKKTDGVLVLYKFTPDPKMIQKSDNWPLPEGSAYVDNAYYVYDVSVLDYHKK